MEPRLAAVAALHDAVKRGDEEAATNLLQSKIIDIDAHDDRKDCFYSPLYTAIENEDIKMARFLLERGASPNFRRAFTVLQIAVRKNRLDLVQLLIDHGAVISNELAIHPFLFIAELKVDTVEYFLKRGDVEMGKEQIEHFLIGCVDLTEELADKMLREYNEHNPNWRDFMEHPFRAQIQHGNFKAAEFFFKANPLMRLDGALETAAQGGHLNRLNFVLQKGAKPTWYTLRAAIVGGSIKMVKELVEIHGLHNIAPFPLEIQDGDFFSRIQLAQQLSTALEKALPYEMHRHVLTYWISPLQVAYLCKFDTIVAYLIGKGACVRELFALASHLRHPERRPATPPLNGPVEISWNILSIPFELFMLGSIEIQKVVVEALPDSDLDLFHNLIGNGAQVRSLPLEVSNLLLHRIRNFLLKHFVGSDMKLSDLIRFSLFYDWCGRLRSNNFQFQSGDQSLEVRIDQSVAQVLFDTTAFDLEKSKCAELGKKRIVNQHGEVIQFPKKIAQFFTLPEELFDDGVERPKKKRRANEEEEEMWTDLGGESEDDEDDDEDIDANIMEED